jgi:hypothetical protein
MKPDEFLWVWHYLQYDPTGTDHVLQNSLALEFLLWCVVILLAALLLRLRPRFLQNLESSCKAFAQHRVATVVAMALLALSLRLALLPLIPIPTPIVHDEYSYILQAQTFASGRVTNPAHPLGVHFETFHVNMWPTYQSMYPPGQAIFLTIGQLFMGHPWWGVWLSVGLMCACVTWMLQGWMPPHWALLGGLFCVLRFSLFSYWMNSYWGGAVAATGGALLLGAIVRLTRKPCAVYALLVALGLLILGNTRPYEGFVFAVPAMVWLLVWIVRRRMWKDATFIARAVMPALGLLMMGGAAMLYYNWRGTGNPLLMPYVINEHTYHITKPFLWQSADPIPSYHHLAMRVFYCYHELPSYYVSRHLWGLLAMERGKFMVYYEFLIWPMLFLMVPAIVSMIRSKRVRIMPITLLAVLVALFIESWLPHGHYAAPLLCAVITIVLYGLRLCNTWRPRNLPVGTMLVRATVLVIFCWSLLPLAGKIFDPYMAIDYGHQPPEIERARLQALLERTPGQHLVIVHERRSYVPAQDWVYNLPDIDSAKVVWARDMGTEGNEELLRYYPNRRVWIVDPYDGINRLMAYDGHSGQDTLASAIGPKPVQPSKQ